MKTRKTRGVKILDRVLQIRQLDWLVVSAKECPDKAAERRIVTTHFRVPHEAWEPTRAFVRPVIVRRDRCRILFRQESGIYC